MHIAPNLVRYFAHATRERGYQYFRQGRVRIEDGSASAVRAAVRGSENYSVLLRWTGDKLAVFCDCLYFLDQDQPCKHLWAVLLAADAAEYLSSMAPVKFPVIDTTALLDETRQDEAGLEQPVTQNPLAVYDELLRRPSIPSAPNRFTQRRSARFTPPPSPQPAAWKKQLSGILQASETVAQSLRESWPNGAEVLYLVDVGASRTANALVLSVETREPKKNGGWKMSKPINLRRGNLGSLPSAADREILSLMTGGSKHYGYAYSNAYEPIATSFQLPSLLAKTVAARIFGSGRCFYSHLKSDAEPVALRWDEGAPWQFVLKMEEAGNQGWQLQGSFRRGQESMELGAPLLTLPGGFLFTPETVAPLAEDAAFGWIANLRSDKPIRVPAQDKDEFLGHLLSAPVMPALELPASLRYEEVRIAPRPCLKIYRPALRYGPEKMRADLSFDYDGRAVAENAAARGFFDAAAGRFVRRDQEAEKAAVALLMGVGMRPITSNGEVEAGWELAPARLPRMVRALMEAGWHIVAEGKSFRSPGTTRAEITSNLDWFELHGVVEYGETTAQLPQLLQALKRGETMVTLDDGSYGLLPEEWLQRFGVVASMGDAARDHIRFTAGQAGLLDALLAAQPSVSCDETFATVRRELKDFQQITAAEQPAGFVGQLRDYQREGLGWMHFLRRFRFGGCLADDMGVGKTAQVLALLETRRELRATGEVERPSLVVVPKSLIFNWRQEAARFTPQLRVLDHTGIGRDKNHFADVDLILTTYGTLRRDAAHFKDMVFDYVILDEAQAIKNVSTESHKAVRLLRGNHHLALSGTPVENHLGELWALFEFLNPGLLGAASAFQLAGGELRNPSEETRQLLAHALRPFILRRTKEQVARELPSKIEQTIYCDLEPRQRKMYNELRQHYRDLLLNKISSEGIAKSKIQVLEALLRLRQAACHPGLIDAKLKKDPSAKLEVLLDQLQEVMQEGHKALVFSQFTSLLAIVRERLKGTNHEYLDGKTTDRQARVERFQNDPKCQLFLISLKAGGLGLNLTAADYVFILDPWWNPAVEAQAVDRAHRIGQQRQVFAYRLIARDTVEEKVLQLQETKRNLADAILGGSSSLIRDLRPEDIELLFS
jgi:superfamily II DNA or RNA helicase